MDKMASDYFLTSVLLQSKKGNEEVSAPKRGRGRPRKNILSKSSNDSVIVLDRDTPTPERKLSVRKTIQRNWTEQTGKQGM